MFHTRITSKIVRSNFLLNHQRIELCKRNYSGPVQGMVKKYGVLAFGVYSTLSFSVFCGCMYSITYMGIRQQDVNNLFNKVKETLGWEIKNEMVEERESTLLKILPASMRTTETVDFLTRVLLAMGMTKLFLPIKLPLVAFITPLLARRLTRMGYYKK